MQRPGHSNLRGQHCRQQPAPDVCRVPIAAPGEARLCDNPPNLKILAAALLDEACRKHGIDLAVLVAETSLWASPEVHRRLAATPEGPVWYPNSRRYRVGVGERKGQVKDGVRFDDNTYANYAIKHALGFKHHELVGFEVCHIWPLTAYEAQYHTCIANLVLLPRPLAGLSDHDQRIAAVLQYRSLELYGWCPDPERPPQRPDAYPTNWRELFPVPQKLPR